MKVFESFAKRFREAKTTLAHYIAKALDIDQTQTISPQRGQQIIHLLIMLQTHPGDQPLEKCLRGSQEQVEKCAQVMMSVGPLIHLQKNAKIEKEILWNYIKKAKSAPMRKMILIMLDQEGDKRPSKWVGNYLSSEEMEDRLAALEIIKNNKLVNWIGELKNLKEKWKEPELRLKLGQTLDVLNESLRE